MKADAFRIDCEGWQIEAETNRLFAHGLSPIDDITVTRRYRKQHMLDTLSDIQDVKTP